MEHVVSLRVIPCHLIAVVILEYMFLDHNIILNLDQNIKEFKVYLTPLQLELAFSECYFLCFHKSLENILSYFVKQKPYIQRSCCLNSVHTTRQRQSRIVDNSEVYRNEGGVAMFSSIHTAV